MGVFDEGCMMPMRGVSRDLSEADDEGLCCSQSEGEEEVTGVVVKLPL